MVRATKNRHRPRSRRKRWRQLMRMVAVFVLLSALVVAISTRHLFTSEAFAQLAAQSSAQASHAPELHLGHEPDQPFEPLLDGSVQPGDIPDSVAIRVLMQTLRVPGNADAAARNQLKVRAGRVGLGEEDFEILVRELGILNTRAENQEARIEAVRTSLAGTARGATARFLEDRYVEEQGNLSSLVAGHYQQLLQSLSPEGAARLQSHLSHIKSRIKIYPTPNMAKQNL